MAESLNGITGRSKNGDTFPIYYFGRKGKNGGYDLVCFSKKETIENPLFEKLSEVPAGWKAVKTDEWMSVRLKKDFSPEEAQNRKVRSAKRKENIKKRRENRKTRISNRIKRARDIRKKAKNLYYPKNINYKKMLSYRKIIIQTRAKMKLLQQMPVDTVKRDTQLLQLKSRYEKEINGLSKLGKTFKLPFPSAPKKRGKKNNVEKNPEAPEAAEVAEAK